MPAGIMHISPARAAGTLTSRFSALAAGSGLEEVYRSAPSVHDGVLPAEPSVSCRCSSAARTSGASPATCPACCSSASTRAAGTSRSGRTISRSPRRFAGCTWSTGNRPGDRAAGFPPAGPGEADARARPVPRPPAPAPSPRTMRSTGAVPGLPHARRRYRGRPQPRAAALTAGSRPRARR